MDVLKETLAVAKTVKVLETWEDMEGATLLVNELALCDTPAANKEFDRLTNLLATPLQPA